MTLSFAKITKRQWQMETWVWSTDGMILTGEKVKKKKKELTLEQD